jgi:hypothetical protein
MTQARTTTTQVLEKTPLRQMPRVAMQGATKVSTSKQTPVSPGLVINVSTGGALMLSSARVEQGAAIQLELGEPIFPVARLVSARVTHVDRAPDHLLAELEQKGKGVGRKAEAYLLGCKFLILDDETRKTLAKFVHDHVDEERQRRAEAQQGDPKVRTARDRAVAIPRPVAPPWSYALGLAVGAYVVATGVWQNADDLTIALHGAAALFIFWIAGRAASQIWLRLEAWRAPEATIVAITDGTAADVVEALADADSALDASGSDPAESASAGSESAAPAVEGTLAVTEPARAAA